jgi:hypothetical protein
MKADNAAGSHYSCCSLCLVGGRIQVKACNDCGQHQSQQRAATHLEEAESGNTPTSTLFTELYCVSVLLHESLLLLLLLPPLAILYS